MIDQEFKHVLSYAQSALDLLNRGKIPPYPHLFELFYTYATGVNTSLNNRINEMFRTGEPSKEAAEQVYTEFLRTQDTSERISDFSERVASRIDAVHGAIFSAMNTANAYSSTLQSASTEFSSTGLPPELGAMTEHLLRETQRMQDANARLEWQLAAAHDDLSTLQHDLDEVRRESLLDPLTKINNRKSFDEGLARAMAKAESGRMCLLLADIDHFKRFNDTWGHQTGDQVLRLVAMTLNSNLKGKDKAARYGGEEFAAILPETELAGAVVAAENIRRAIQSKELLKRSTNEKLGRVTASFGIAVFRSGDTAASLIERADRCLYAAKHAGRNRVVDETDLDKMGKTAA